VLTLATDHSGGADHAADQGLTHPSSISHASATGIPPEPRVSGIHAVFNPSPPGTKCEPSYCTTVYSVTAKGHHLTYAWSLKIKADPGCARGFHPGTPAPNEATWYHADETEGGPCNHAGSEYYPATFGHPGKVKVVVKDNHWTCTARFHGTQGATGAPVADGPDAVCELTKK